MSAYLDTPCRSLCPVCRERPAKQETELCQRCEDDAQADIGRLRERLSVIRQYLMEGKR